METPIQRFNFDFMGKRKNRVYLFHAANRRFRRLPGYAETQFWH